MFGHELNRLARRQHGVFNHSQAALIGFSDTMIADRVRGGGWLRLAPGVYALPSHPGTFLRQCWASILSEPSAAIGGMAAAALWTLGEIRPGRVEIVVPTDGNARHPLATVHRYADPLVTTRDGLPITTVAQTIMDIARRCSYERMDRIIDSALLGRLTTLPLLEERLAAYEGTRRAGLPLARAMISDRMKEGWAPNESELEHRLDPLLRQLPGDGRVLRQHSFPWRQAEAGRVDRWLPGYRLIVEADGRRWHARLADFDRDRWRDNVAASRGIFVLRFTWVHLTERPREARDLVIATGQARLRAA